MLNLHDAATAMGRKGGLKRVPKGIAKMTKTKRAEVSRAGVIARWGCKECQCHPCTCDAQWNDERKLVGDL